MPNQIPPPIDDTVAQSPPQAEIPIGEVIDDLRSQISMLNYQNTILRLTLKRYQ